MISYDNRDIWSIICRRSGSVVFSTTTLLPAFASTCLCAAVLTQHDMKYGALLSGTVVQRIYASILGFVIVFRTNMAFSRYFEGVSCVQGMFAKWGDSFAALAVFFEISITDHRRRGDMESAKLLTLSKARLLHWFSVLSALAVQKLKGNFLLDEPIVEWPGPENRMEVKREARHRCSKEVMQELEEEHRTRMQVIGAITEEEKKQIMVSHDEVLLVLRWILMEMSTYSINGKLLIAPPILSRVYQELSNGMLGFFMAMKIALVPFPFPFAQFLQFALLAFFMFCPLIMVPHMQDHEKRLSQTWMSLAMNFLACAGFMALNEIAVELEDPFGDDDNDYPVHQRQWALVRAMEDIYHTKMPSDFCADSLGEDSILKSMSLKRSAASAWSAAQVSKEAVAPQPPLQQAPPQQPSVSSAAPSDEVSQVIAELQQIQRTLQDNVGNVRTSSEAFFTDLSRLESKFDDVIPEFMFGLGAQASERERPRIPDNTDERISEASLRELIDQHLLITSKLQTFLAAEQDHLSDSVVAPSNTSLSNSDQEIVLNILGNTQGLHSAYPTRV